MPIRELKEKSPHYENIAALGRLNRVAEKLFRSNPANKQHRPMDISSEDVRSLLASLNKFEVKYILVGGMAGVVHGHIRTTSDMDLWVRNDAENSRSLVQALSENQVPGTNLLQGMPPVFGLTSVRFGLSGFELDLGHRLKAFEESDFDSCYERSLKAEYDGVPFSVIQLNDLIVEKKATGRAKDLGDVEVLQRIWEQLH